MPDLAPVVKSIDAALPDLARGVIERYLDLQEPANRRFLSQPDAREEHQTNWHQWGIITHTRVFLHHFDTTVPNYLRAWGVWDDVNNVMMQKVDGVRKRELLKIAILLHDIGKFGARRRGKYRFHFSGHEELSGAIVRRELDLGQYGLTPDQIDYIALTAQDHFVLGLVRREARNLGEYDERFIKSAGFAEIVRSIMLSHPHDYVEIGILFLGDSLAKMDPEEDREHLEPAMSQYHINILVAHRYLELVLGHCP